MCNDENLKQVINDDRLFKQQEILHIMQLKINVYFLIINYYFLIEFERKIRFV